MLTYQCVRDVPLSLLEFFSVFHRVCFQQCENKQSIARTVLRTMRHGKKLKSELEAAENGGNLRKRRRGNSSMIRRSSKVSKFTRIIYLAHLVSGILPHFCRFFFLPRSSRAAGSILPPLFLAYSIYVIRINPDVNAMSAKTRRTSGIDAFQEVKG